MTDRPEHRAAPVEAGSSHLGIDRRTLLGATVASATAAAAVTATPRAWAAAPAARNGSARFAMITDTHTNVTSGPRNQDLARVLQHIESRDPDFVLHCGDITDYGSDEETTLYRSLVPSGLWPRMHHVPGNHETQWNADAWEGYHQSFGPAHYSFDAAGLHVIALDPLVSQQWPSGQFSELLLEDIRADLAQVPADVPIVVFNHFPMNDSYQFVENTEDLFSIIADHRVRVAFAGHIHQRRVDKFNGITEVTGDALIHAPVYYWAERVTDADGDRLAIHEVHVPESGEVQQELITHAPLDDVGPGGAFGPLDVRLAGDRDAITVAAALAAGVRRGPSSGPSQVKARVFPQGVTPASWTPLVRRGHGPWWHGKLDATMLPPGSHRVQFQASEDGTDPVWNGTSPVDIPSTTAQVAWTHRLPAGTVTAGLAHRDDLVVAATVEGDVEALSAGPGGARTVWRTKLDGGVFKAPVFAPDGKSVLLGSADHRVSALDSATGRTVWRHDLGAPVQCELALLDLPAGRAVGVAAGTSFHTVALDGSTIWTADLGGSFSGRACSGGGLVHAGSSDGNAYAFDAGTGARVWSRMLATSSDNAYHRMIYGPWAAQLEMVGNGNVFIPCHTSAAAVAADSGDVQWSIGGSHRMCFTRPMVSRYGILVFDGKEGTASLLDRATGSTTWENDTALPFVAGTNASWGSAPVPTGDPGKYWMVSTAGLLAAIDLSQPDITTVLKVSNTYTTSTPALVSDELLVTVDSHGTVRGITGLVAARG